MLAVKNQIPTEELSKEAVKVYPHKRDTLYAHIRRLTSRVRDLEQEIQTLRRTFNRIERKQYNELSKLPAQPKELETPEVESVSLGMLAE